MEEFEVRKESEMKEFEEYKEATLHAMELDR